MTSKKRFLRPALLLAGIIIASLIAVQFILFSGQKARKLYHEKKAKQLSFVLRDQSIPVEMIR
ncbi:MAG: hypothetical protein WBB45_06015 [Cyclobacteriaceae bacterium]